MEEEIKSFFRPEQSAEAWHQALLTLPNPHPLQTWPWGEFKSRWGWTMRPLLLDVGEPNKSQTPNPQSPIPNLQSPIQNPLAAALILKRKVPRLPFSILYVPKGPVLDYNHVALRRVVLAQLEQIARREKAIFIKIDPDVVASWGLEEPRASPIGAAFVRELINRGWRFSDDQVQFRNTVELDLERPEEDILAAMKQKTRYNIRLAGRKEITIRQGTPADFPTIVELYRQTAERDAFSIRPAGYYLDAWQSFYDAGLAQPFLAEYQGKALAAVLLVHFGGRAIYMYGASTDEERQRMPNHLLQWESIRYAKAQGCRVYDFWGAPNEFNEADSMWGVWKFKEGFNGQVVRHIGAWDYPARPFWYWLYTVVMPKYLNLLRRRGAEQQGAT
jgi:peptidoglycan pentaglycine glycine transferase (the first glycine)